LSVNDIGVFEIHEAFAGQILSNLTAMKSQKFADEKFNGQIVGDIDLTKMNTKGGSLAVGHDGLESVATRKSTFCPHRRLCRRRNGPRVFARTVRQLKCEGRRVV
jgi:Thiolase, C-terminal domain